jgi:hypothetical protein
VTHSLHTQETNPISIRLVPAGRKRSRWWGGSGMPALGLLALLPAPLVRVCPGRIDARGVTACGRMFGRDFPGRISAVLLNWYQS